MEQREELTIDEARVIAILLNPASAKVAFAVGSVVMGGLAMWLLDDPWQRFGFFIVGGVLGTHYGVPLLGHIYLRRLDRDYFAGMSDAVVRWFRGASDDDELDLDALAAKHRAAPRR